MYAKERLYLTADRKALVPEGDKRAASLYAAVGHEIPDSAAALFGLVDGKLGAASPTGEKDGGNGADKEKAPGQDKEKTPGQDKQAGTKDTDRAAAGDDLTQVKFIGTTSAKALIAAGINSYAHLAAIDPANPPKVKGMGAQANWSGIVASAIELHEAGPDADADKQDGAAEGAGGADSGADQKDG